MGLERSQVLGASEDRRSYSAPAKPPRGDSLPAETAASADPRSGAAAATRAAPSRRAPTSGASSSWAAETDPADRPPPLNVAMGPLIARLTADSLAATQFGHRVRVAAELQQKSRSMGHPGRLVPRHPEPPTAPDALPQSVTHVPGLKCYPCPRSEPSDLGPPAPRPPRSPLGGPRRRPGHPLPRPPRQESRLLATDRDLDAFQPSPPRASPAPKPWPFASRRPVLPPSTPAGPLAHP